MKNVLKGRAPYHDPAPRFSRLGHRVGLLLALCMTLTGCGKSMQHSATEQLVLSDAVDRTVSAIDFTPLAGAKCYLDSTKLPSVKSSSFVNAPYVISSLRNQLIAAGCLLAESKTDAEVIVEPRLGTLGTDEHEVTYGIPSSSLLSQAASLVPTAPPIPTIPEISLAKKDDQTGAAKLAVFAYHAETGRPIWQSGMSVARSTARNTWVFGVGPFQSGTVYDSPQFAGSRIALANAEGVSEGAESTQVISFDEAFLFAEPASAKPEETAMVEKTKKAD